MTDYYRIPSVIGASLNFGVNGTAYVPFFTADHGTISNTTEANVQVKHQIASKIKNLRLYVSSNSATVTTTIKIRINGADGQNSVSISAGATGWFEDTTNTDDIAAGDKICYSLSKADANTVVIKNLLADVLATAPYQKGGYYTGGKTLSTASTATYFPFGGTVDSTTESLSQKRRIRSSCTGKNLQVYVSSNPRSTTTTVRSRVNGANGNQVISISAGATGWFEDTSNTDTLVQDDDYSASITTGTGSGSLVIQHISADIQGTTSTSIAAGPSGGTMSTNQTRYWSPAGGTPAGSEATEANASIKFRGTGTISKLAVGVATNGSDQTTTFTARKNAADQSPTCSIAASTTGFSSDNSNSFTYADADLIAVKGVRSSGGTGTIAPTWIAFELAPDAETISGGTTTATGSASGTGTASGTGKAISNATASSSGTGASSVVGKSIFKAVAASTGIAASAVVGSSKFKGVGSTAGMSSPSAVGSSKFRGVASSAGTSIATCAGASRIAASGSSSGTTTVSGYLSAVSRALGTVAGQAAVTGVLRIVFKAVAGAVGLTVLDGVGQARGRVTAVAESSGVTTIDGVGFMLSNWPPRLFDAAGIFQKESTANGVFDKSVASAAMFDKTKGISIILETED